MADRRQTKTRQRRGFVDVVNALLTLVVLGLLVAGGLALYGAHTFYAASPTSTDTTFVVEKGNNLGAVAERLEQKGLIDNRYIFQIGGYALKKQGGLKTGEYKLAAGASMFDILKTLTESKPISLSVTIPEGFTVAQVIDKLNGIDKLTGDITVQPPEGSLMPDTYDFDPGATRQSVLDRMEAAMTAKLGDIWQGRDQSLPLTSPEQLVTMASIVEKETPVPGERAKIAGVYYNRLAKHMRLQSDPTVVYGITKGAGPTGRAPTRAELDQQTPYNTYQVDGLPPGPIANPGAEALKAAANPAKSLDLYFVAVSLNPKDGHYFAANYADHRKNVAKLRVVEKQQAAADAEADADAAKDQLEEQQAAESGDSTAATAPTATATASPDQTATPGAPTAPATDPGTDAAVAPATTDAATTDTTASTPSVSTDPNVPVPMPADERPGDTAQPATTAPATDAATTDTPTTDKPAPKPTKPRTPARDTFGG
jgi:UPF0755 protein